MLYILERHAGDPEEAIARAVNDTKDNDPGSTASIAGQVFGAARGFETLPNAWVRRLDVLGPALALLRRLFATATAAGE